MMKEYAQRLRRRRPREPRTRYTTRAHASALRNTRSRALARQCTARNMTQRWSAQVEDERERAATSVLERCRKVNENGKVGPNGNGNYTEKLRQQLVEDVDAMLYETL